MKISFREFLREKFASMYTGLDDEMPDQEADWFANLDPEEVIDYAEEWGQGKSKTWCRKCGDEMIYNGEVTSLCGHCV